MKCRDNVKQWVMQYPQTSLVIVVEGDVHSETGQTIYNDLDGSPSHCSIKEVSGFLPKNL
jgi:hypothetical protein